MRLFTVNGTYGSNQTPTEVFCATNFNGTYYVADGGLTVNLTLDDVCDGVDIETLNDVDCFTWATPIYGLSELEQAIKA